MPKFTTRDLAVAGIIAALYASLTLFLPSYTAIQIRLSEALTVLPFLFPAAAPGVIIGCLVANLLSPYGAVDIICGTLATAVAVYCTTRVKHQWLAPLPPVICNGIIIGAMIAWYEVGFGDSFWPLMALNGATVALGELIACYGLGIPLLKLLPKIQPLQMYLAPRHMAQQ